MNLPWQITEPIDARIFSEIKRAAIFECCKWDPQVEDVCTLSPLPVKLTSEAWKELVSLSEKLAQETIAAETFFRQDRRFLKELGIPWRLRRRLTDPEIAAEQSRQLRLIRFDFHFTTEGWRISEANTDVPGGFNEASGFTRLMARHYGPAVAFDDPTQAMVRAIGKTIGKSGTVALVHATSFIDDRQVMVFLARRLEAAGHKAVLVAPDHLRWENGKAWLATDWTKEPVDFVFRFFPAEWLPALPRRCAWWHLLGSSQTPLCNPGSAIVSQSKRFPLLWSKLPFRLPTWEALLPATFDVRDVHQHGLATDGCVFKPAFGRVGDMIKMHGLTTAKENLKIDKAIRRYPKLWVAQKRFEAVPLTSSLGDFFPCIGVYTLNASVIGAYGRIARRPLIDHLAQDAAVLIAEAPVDQNPNQSLKHESRRSLQTLDA
jgi:hypothetical protein